MALLWYDIATASLSTASGLLVYETLKDSNVKGVKVNLQMDRLYFILTKHQDFP